MYVVYCLLLEFRQEHMIILAAADETPCFCNAPLTSGKQLAASWLEGASCMGREVESANCASWGVKVGT